MALYSYGLVVERLEGIGRRVQVALDRRPTDPRRDERPLGRNRGVSRVAVLDDHACNTDSSSRKATRVPPTLQHDLRGAPYRRRRRHAHCAGMGAPVLEMTALEERRSF